MGRAWHRRTNFKNSSAVETIEILSNFYKLCPERSRLLFFGSVSSAEHMKWFLFSEHFPGPGSCPSTAAHVSAQRGVKSLKALSPGLWNPLQSWLWQQAAEQNPGTHLEPQDPGMKQHPSSSGSTSSGLFPPSLTKVWAEGGIFTSKKGTWSRLGWSALSWCSPSQAEGTKTPNWALWEKGTQNWAPELSTRICPQFPNPITPRTAILNIPTYKVFNPGPDVVAGISWHCRNFLWISLQVLSSAFSIPGMVLGSEALCCSLSLCSCALPSRFPHIHWFLFIYLTPHYSRDINQNPHHVPNSESKQFLLGHKLSSQAI